MKHNYVMNGKILHNRCSHSLLCNPHSHTSARRVRSRSLYTHGARSKSKLILETAAIHPSIGCPRHRCTVATCASTTEATSTKPKPTFDLALAVALAGTAFESYLEPTGAEGFQQVTLNETKITYTDRVFVGKHFQGLLEVKLLRAAGLPAADFTGKSDPYVVFTLGDSAAKSTFKFQTLDPEWNETFVLYVRDIEEDVLKVRVFDKDFLDSDDDLGVIIRGLRDLQPNEMSEVELKLQGNGGGGTVFLQLTLLPFTGPNSAVLDMLTADDVKAEGLSGLFGSSPEVPSMMADLKERMNTTAEQDDLVEEQAVTASGESVGPSWTSSISWEQLQGMINNIGALKDSLPLGTMQPPADSPPASLPSETTASSSSESTAAVILDPALMPKAWKVLASVAGKQIEDHFLPVAFVENDETDTQAWVYQNIPAREVVVAFRGTEQVKWKDFVTDLNLTPCSLNPERVDSNAGLPFAMRLLAVRKQEEMVHMGFLSAYDSVRGQVLKLVQQILGSSSRPWNIYITGHSLGGALATLCSYELALRMARAGVSHHVCMYTYGAPRVGNKEFASNFHKYVPDSWRITNASDIIPTVPRLMGYSHVKRGVKLSKEGQLIFEDGPTDVFGEGRHTREVLEELMQKVQDEKWEEVYESIQSAEMELLNLLVSGEALEQHMETFYLQTLRQCVLKLNPTLSKDLDLESLVKKPKE